jgi:hypothetical protein
VTLVTSFEQGKRPSNHQKQDEGLMAGDLPTWRQTSKSAAIKSKKRGGGA